MPVSRPLAPFLRGPLECIENTSEVGIHREKAFSGIKGHVEGLTFKREPFRHESEVRLELLYVDADRSFEGKEFIEVPIDANAVIDEIMLDPRTHVSGGQYGRIMVASGAPQRYDIIFR